MTANVKILGPQSREGHRAVIYAVGGGRGHAVRGVNLCRLLSRRCHVDRLIIREGALHSLPKPPGEVRVEEISEETPPSHGEDLLVVDTFPFGWRDSLSRAWIESFPYRIFVARYNRLLDWQTVQDLYHEIWLPYATPLQEWDDVPKGAVCIGTLVRTDASQSQFAPRKFMYIDTERRCSSALVQETLEEATRCGFDAEYTCELPARIVAHKVLVVGAGYNTFYELCDSPLDIKFVPIKKRFDDQMRRVRRFGRGIESRGQLQEWLQSFAFFNANKTQSKVSTPFSIS